MYLYNNNIKTITFLIICILSYSFHSNSILLLFLILFLFRCCLILLHLVPHKFTVFLWINILSNFILWLHCNNPIIFILNSFSFQNHISCSSLLLSLISNHLILWQLWRSFLCCGRTLKILFPINTTFPSYYWGAYLGSYTFSIGFYFTSVGFGGSGFGFSSTLGFSCTLGFSSGFSWGGGALVTFFSSFLGSGSFPPKIFKILKFSILSSLIDHCFSRSLQPYKTPKGAGLSIQVPDQQLFFGVSPLFPLYLQVAWYRLVFEGRWSSCPSPCTSPHPIQNQHRVPFRILKYIFEWNLPVTLVVSITMSKIYLKGGFSNNFCDIFGFSNNEENISDVCFQKSAIILIKFNSQWCSDRFHNPSDASQESIE